MYKRQVQTLEAVDLYEPEYQRVIRSPRPQGPAALLAEMGVFDTDELWGDDEEDDYDDDDEEFDYETVMRELLEDAVGGPSNLRKLNTKPLPDEKFQWAKAVSYTHLDVYKRQEHEHLVDL